MSRYDYYGFRPYVPVAKRRANAEQHATKLAKQEGRTLQPVKIEGRKIATTFWGTAWCENLERYSDFANRLPRGRTYVRNGSVIDLQIRAGRVEAIVSGSEIYTVKIDIARLNKADWTRIKADCAASIDSLMDLLAGRFSNGVMNRLTRTEDGLFPRPQEIKIACSCPDWATLCKHAAAVLYGVGAHLDRRPELLFLLRDVDHNDLVTEAVAEGNLETALSGSENGLAGEDLGAMFGIELDSAAEVPADATVKTSRGRKKTASPAGKKITSKSGKSQARSAKTRPKTTTASKTRTTATTKTKKTAGRQTSVPEKSAPGKKPTKNKAAAAKVAMGSKQKPARKSAAGKTSAGSKTSASSDRPGTDLKKPVSRRLRSAG